MADDFDYMVFPIAFDVTIRTDSKITNVYGSNDTDSNHEGRLAYISTLMASNIGSKGIQGGIILLKMSEI